MPRSRGAPEPSKRLPKSFWRGYTTQTPTRRKLATLRPTDPTHSNSQTNCVNSHHSIRYTSTKLPYPLKPRDYVTRQIYCRVDKNTYVLVFDCVDDDASEAKDEGECKINEVADSLIALRSLRRSRVYPFSHCNDIILSQPQASTKPTTALHLRNRHSPRSFAATSKPSSCSSAYR